jgi:hypothetical protein
MLVLSRERGSTNPPEQKETMHNLMLAFAFIAMLISPAMVAAFSGKKNYEPEADSEEIAPAPREARKAEVIRPASVLTAQNLAARKQTTLFEAPTLPMHGTLGMANR